MKNRLRMLVLVIIMIFIPLTVYAMSMVKLAKNLKSASVMIVTLKSDHNGISSIGSGFFINKHTILTCYHVIKFSKNVEDIRIFINGDQMKSFSIKKIIKSDEKLDYVILETDDIAPNFLKLGNSDNIETGQLIYTYGNPNGIMGIFSNGIVSGRFSRLIDPNEGIIFSAPVSPGSSGGPLVDESGRVIGIVQALMQDAQLINVAIPINKIDLKDIN